MNRVVTSCLKSALCLLSLMIMPLISAAQCSTDPDVSSCNPGSVEFENILIADLDNVSWTCLEAQCLTDAPAFSDYNAVTPTDCFIDPESKTTWYTLFTGDDAGDLFIYFESTEYFAPQIAVYKGDCTTLTYVTCAENQSYELALPRIPLERQAYYHIAVSSQIESTAEYDLCVLATEPVNECGHSIEITEIQSSNDNTPVGGPYAPEEIVTFRAEIFFESADECQWLQAIIPTFGSGWQFNGLDLQDPNAPPAAVFQSPESLFGGEWNWYGPNDVNYLSRNPWISTENFFPLPALGLASPLLDANENNPTLQFMDPLPGGWFATKNGDPDNPNDAWGDGSPCDGVYGPWTVEFALITRADLNSLSTEERNCDVQITIFGDGETGNWFNPSCVGYLPEVFHAMAGCQAEISFDIRDTFVCNNDNFTIPINVSNDTAIVSWTAEIPDGIEGAASGSGDIIEQRLFNTTSTPQDVVHTITALLDGCTATQTFTITVYPDDLEDIFPDSLAFCRDTQEYVLDIPLGIEINGIDASGNIATDIIQTGDQLQLYILAQSAGEIGIQYASPCDTGLTNELIQLSPDTQITVNYHVVCSGRFQPDFNAAFTKDTQLIQINMIGNCPEYIIDRITVLDADAGPDTTLNCGSDSILVIGQSYDTTAIRTWTGPGSQQISGDSAWISVPGQYIFTVLYDNQCTARDTLIVDSTYRLDISADINQCRYDSLEAVVTGLSNPDYLWNTGDTTPTIAADRLTWYSVTVQDRDNPSCVVDRSIYTALPDTCTTLIRGFLYNQYGDSCHVQSPKWPAAEQKVLIHPLNWMVTTDSTGKYEANVPVGSYTVRPVLSRTPLTICPDSQMITVSNPGGTLDSIDFCIIDTIGCDLNVLPNSSLARPGREVRFYLTAYNDGNIPLENISVRGAIDPQYDLNELVEIYPVDSINLSSSSIYWTIPSLAPGELVVIQFNILLDPTGLMQGDLLQHTFSLQGGTCPPEPVNFEQVVVTSYDPNDKQLDNLVGRDFDGVLRSDSTYKFTIRFQNLGNDTAFLVRITDLISEDFDLATFTPGPASHPYEWEILPDRLATFTFDPIELPYASIDEEGSQGFVSFTIERSGNLAIGDSITNNADIYFDFNAPVRTNTVVAEYIRPVFEQNLSVEICEGSAYNGMTISNDTIIEEITALFDFDSIKVVDISVIPQQVFEIDTSVAPGEIILGQVITSDTIVEQEVLDELTGCFNLFVWNISTVTSTVDYGQGNIEIFPNPFSDGFNLRSERKIREVILYDNYTREIKRLQLGNAFSSYLDMTGLSSGVYILRIHYESGVQRQFRVIKQ